MVSDEAAYRRYLSGEEKAADLLAERYGDALTLYINGYIKDIHEAEDLMIEAFAQLFAKERLIGGKGSFKAYLTKPLATLPFGIIRNTVLSSCAWMSWTSSRKATP